MNGALARLQADVAAAHCHSHLFPLPAPKPDKVPGLGDNPRPPQLALRTHPAQMQCSMLLTHCGIHTQTTTVGAAGSHREHTCLSSPTSSASLQGCLSLRRAMAARLSPHSSI